MEFLLISFQFFEFLGWHAVSYNEPLGLPVDFIFSHLGLNNSVYMFTNLGWTAFLFYFVTLIGLHRLWLLPKDNSSEISSFFCQIEKKSIIHDRCVY